MSAPNFNLISEVMQVTRRDFSMAVPALLNPNNANPLIDGEWLELNSSYQLIRGSGAGAGPSFPVFAERGRYDTQAIAKVPVLFMGMYEAETRVCDLTGLAVGDFLSVQDVTVDALTRKGLKEAAGSGQHYIVGQVTRLPGSGIVRFIHQGGFQITI
jgi:hypothetical protein